MKTCRIAFYGKGGIGKSTIASNISALLAMQGKKVLHIGCDPKADSTRLLCRGRIRTVLDVLEEKEEPEREELVHRTEYGVWCVESGGPEAGNGCAGLGIITAMREMERLEVLEEDWDVIVYDVLGDVVCGGFSVPMREGYVDKVYIVSSTDFMSLYAANNILKGVVRYSDEKSMFGGFVFNHMHGEEECQIARKFAQKVGGKNVAMIRESRELKRADFRKEMYAKKFFFSANENQQEFVRLAEDICKMQVQGLEKCPVPMSREQMEAFGTEIEFL